AFEHELWLSFFCRPRPSTVGRSQAAGGRWPRVRADSPSNISGADGPGRPRIDSIVGAGGRSLGYSLRAMSAARLLALAFLLTRAPAEAPAKAPPAARTPALFSRNGRVELRIEAHFDELIRRSRTNPNYRVVG